MVRKTAMSSTNGGGEGESGEAQSRGKDELPGTKDRMRLQQRLIDMAARDLESTRSSYREIAPGSEHAFHALEENILLQENKLMKYFSRQLMHKHQHLHQYPIRDEEIAADVERQLDALISLNMFLTITGIEQRSAKILLDAEAAEGLTLDGIFSMGVQELQQLFLRLDLPQEDLHKVVRLLDLLSYYFEIWERGEKPTAGAYDIRRYSSSGRLSSIASIASLDNRKDSCSSRMSAVSPTTGPQLQHSRSSTPVTPLTPSSIHSISATTAPVTITTVSLGLPYQYSSPALLTTSVDSSPPFTKKSSLGSSSGYFTGSEQPGPSYSSSSSSLNSDMSAPQPAVHPAPTQLEEPPKPKRRLGHTRSHSNPPLANLILPVAVPENEVASDYRSPSPPYYSTTALTTRTGSQPSIVQYSTLNSPSTKTHPQMRRIMASGPHFSRSISQELNGSESTRPHTHAEAPFRSNSEASGVQAATPRQRRLSKDTGTSASMVDLPLVRTSNEELDQVEYSLPQSGKSHSVPRLAYHAVNGDNSLERVNHHSTSVPTSPRVPSEYNPTGVMGHAIRHRFVSKTYLKPHLCDYCKKTMVMQGCKCKDCKYKCHKSCAKLAPPSCGLSRELIKYFKRHLLLGHTPAPSLENVIQQVQYNQQYKQQTYYQTRGKGGSLVMSSSSSAQSSPQTPPAMLSQSRVLVDGGELTEDDETHFMIPNLSREPFNSQYSPVVNRRHQPQAGSPVHDHEVPVFTHQTSATRLEVPNTYHPSPLHQQHYRPHHSTSSSPSTSPHSSPCNTPVSLHSPTEHMNMELYPNSYASYTSGYTSSVPVIFTDDSADDESYMGRQRARRERFRSEEDSQYLSSCSSQDSSQNDISDTDRLSGPRGLRPPPQVVSAQSLPNLLLPNEEQSPGSPPNSLFSSEDNLKWQRDSLVNTVSTADSKASTLVDSLPAEDDDTSSYAESDMFNGGSQGTIEEGLDHRQFRLHRQSVVDEWIIPYDDLRFNKESLTRSMGTEVFRAYWHGEVAVKQYYMPNATLLQIQQFKEKVSLLKKIRHDNLVLFMGACFTPPNFAIVTSFSKGPTIYKRIHHWGESFSVDKVVNISRQIAQAMGYLHARGILHKNLTTRNVFLEKTVEKDKVVITDTGFSCLNTWQRKDEQSLCIERTKLCYFAPEIMKRVPSHRKYGDSEEYYPFTEKSDVYSFGTILYEMLTKKFPFAADRLGFTYEPQVIIYLISMGRRQEFKNHDVPKKLKDLVWSCWNEDPFERPAFSDLKENLARQLRKHTPITRSPSHPINLSKSVDNLLYI